MSNKIVILTDRSKVLKTPGRYIGSIETKQIEKMVVTPDFKSVTEKMLNFNPGLFKIVEEVFDNALDECKRHDKQGRKPNLGDIVSFSIDEHGKWITISDNGNGIPTNPAKNEDGTDSEMTMYQAAWTKLGAGTNFDGFTEEDSEARGQNGEGVCLTNIFSKEFKGFTQHKDTFVSVVCKDNMEDIQISEQVNPGKPSGTTVQFLPDYEKFGETHFTYDHQLVVMYYFAILSIQYPHIKFYFQGVQISYTMEQLIAGITHGKKSESEMIKVEGLTVIVLPSNSYKFKQYINGSDADAGGNPIEWVTKKVVDGFISALPKKYSDIKSGGVESKLQIIALFDGMVKPRFEGQTKNKCITPYAKFSKSIDEKSLDWKAFGAKLFKNKMISANIIIYHEIELKALEKKKAVGDEKSRKGTKVPVKFTPATKTKRYFVVSEGDSAINSFITACDREDKGYYPVGGKPLNVIKNPKKVTANDTFKELCSPDLLDLSFVKDNTSMNYDFFVMAPDADPDGVHIAGLFLGFFNSIHQRALIEKRVKLLQTPIVMLKNRRTEKTEKVFFTQYEYDAWLLEDINNIKKFDIQYKKGLGSLSETEWEEFFEMYSFQELLVTIYIRDPEIDNDGYIQDISMIEAWLDEDSDIRKEFIANYIEAIAENKDLRSLELQLLNEDGSEIPDPEFIEK
jgi:DNA gyrase/topoisomerase IV subunit B